MVRIKRNRISLLWAQCEWALGQRVDVIRCLGKCLRISPFSAGLTALCAAGVWICSVTHFNLAVNEHKRVVSVDILKGFYAPALRLRVGTRME